MSTIIIHQNPNLVKVGGYEKLGRSIHPGTKIGFTFSTVNGEIKTSLNKSQTELVEKFYNKRFSDGDALEYYSRLKLEVLSDKVVAWDLSKPDLLFSYGIATYLGILAADAKAIENPLCSATHYVYNSEEESNYLSEYNELKGEVIYQLTKFKKESPEKVITLSKYMFNSFEIYTPAKAYNKLVEFAEKHTKSNPTLKTLKANLEHDYADIELTVLVQECINKGIIVRNANQYFENKENRTEYGKSNEEIKTFLKKNPDELGEGKATDKVYALRRLIKF